MSTPKQAVDIQALNDFFDSTKKRVKTEFAYTRILKITEKFSKVSLLQGYVARGELEAYFGNYLEAEKWFKTAFQISDNKSVMPLYALLEMYIKTANVEKFNELILWIFNIHIDLVDEDFFKGIKHFVSSFLDLDALKILKEFNFGLKFNSLILDLNQYVEDIFPHIDFLGISLSIYQQVIKLMYLSYFENYNGSVKVHHNIYNDQLIVRVFVNIFDAEELFELNNKLNDRLVAWYSGENDNIMNQLDKIIFYFQSGYKNNVERVGEVNFNAC